MIKFLIEKQDTILEDLSYWLQLEGKNHKGKALNKQFDLLLAIPY